MGGDPDSPAESRPRLGEGDDSCFGSCAAREFQQRFPAGMIGINVGVPAPMAWFPFTGWHGSFFGDLHMQGLEGLQFYTQQKVTMTRWFATAEESAQDAIWRSVR